MLTKRHRWTEEDEKLIRISVEKNATNLTNAFKAVAKKLKVSPSAVARYYYRYIQKKPTNKLFLTVSSKRAATNYKVTRKGKKATNYQPERTKKSKWKRILAILAE